MNSLRQARIWLQYIVPMALVLFTNVTLQWDVVPVDQGPEHLYGFPLPYATSAIACSFCNHFFLGPLLIDLLCYFLFAVGLLLLIKVIGLDPGSRPMTIGLALLIAAVAVFLRFGYAVIGPDDQWTWWDQYDLHPLIGRKLIFGPIIF